MSSSSSRMMWEIDQQEKELFNQSEGMFNLQIAQKEMEEDEERTRRDDETRMVRATHSRPVIQTVAQICRPRCSRNLDRSRQRRGQELLDDYFVHNSAFPDTYFRRRFRMERHLFNRIMIDVCNHDSYFLQKKDACGVMGLLPEQKATAALRMLAYGAFADQVDEITRMGKSTILEALMRFCGAVESLYTAEYLRKPTHRDLQRLLKKAEMQGVLPKYFSSEWSVAQFRLLEGSQYIVAFGHQKNTVVILGMDGSFYRCEFDPVNGEEMTQLEYHNFLKPKEAF